MEAKVVKFPTKVNIDLTLDEESIEAKEQKRKDERAKHNARMVEEWALKKKVP